MSQISVNNLTFGYEGSYDNVFEKVSFSIDTNWKLGFIGRNGKGKTTFLRLLLGKYEFSGSIHTTTRFDYFPYEIAEAKMENPIADFMDELKPGCELWKVICELEKLSENANILYIDVFSRMQLEQLILAYEPTILFVEHDVKFCEQIATQVVKL